MLVPEDVFQTDIPDGKVVLPGMSNAEVEFQELLHGLDPCHRKVFSGVRVPSQG